MSALPAEPSIAEAHHIGFTGTRGKLTERQGRALLAHMRGIAEAELVALRPVVLHHGVCTGADEAAHWIAKRLHWLIHGHPGCDEHFHSPHRAVECMGSLDFIDRQVLYAARNRTIVSWAHQLIACPAYAEDHRLAKRSGTWQTVRLAREALVPITIIMPDGNIEKEQ